MSNRKPTVTFQNPAIDEALNIIKSAISKRKVLIIIGNCWVNYEGRAKSKLEPGERILIIKEDSSVLVHRACGYEPINWQPADCILHTDRKRDTLVIRAIRKTPREVMSIFLDQIFQISVLDLVDRGGFFLYASEEDMQKAILARPSLIEDGLKPITFEKKVDPGFVDVYCEDNKGRMVVIEIKRRAAGRDAVLQLAKYVESVRGIVNRDVRGILVAPTIAKGAQNLLETFSLEFRRLDPRTCSTVLGDKNTKRLLDFY
ncbi:MAG: endonuclease NucS [Nitrososphaerota archaeon]|nr:endonuclease NucS [Candidatus Bathyarchaeota archaeon]MDW8048839.1 endonuclease NucS [Nitrososphaerota archaeon]